MENTVELNHFIGGAVVVLPILSFSLLLFFGKKLNGAVAGIIGTTVSAMSFVAVLISYFSLRGAANAEERHAVVTLFEWINVGNFKVDAALRFDTLSITMALFVTGIGTLIHLYAIGYMKGDPRFSRFFVYLNLFLASMLILVLGNNLLLTFVGWEGVGTCSYLLISFWFEKESAASAGKKAFVTNRIGDFGFLLAMFMIVSKLSNANSLDFDVFLSDASLKVLAPSATAICLLFFLGACGKSAQLPLFVWLPDAMEGPTPVSALIHAATMVTAGVYLLVRVHPLIDLSTTAAMVIATVGAATAFFAATVAVAQTDIKRVLAYSTISQLGYMFLAVGSGAYVGAMFHMVTHAFFKALLFLGAGSVIYGLHHEQDMKKMGGLRKLMPITSMTFIIGWLAIAGVPPFAGFWSKDEILHAAYNKNVLLWATGLVTALLTAYYMTRQVVLVWFGQSRVESHGHDAEVHESPRTMTIPLIVLAVLSVLGGLINLPFGPKHALEKWLEPVLASSHVEVLKGSAFTLGLVATVVAACGVAVGYLIWSKSATNDKLEPKVLKSAWGIDRLYALVIERPGHILANFSAFTFDKKGIDGAVNGAATATKQVGQGMRIIQTGFIRTYALSFVLGVVAILGFALVRVFV